MPQSTKKVDGGRIGGPAVIPNCIEVIIPWTLANGRTGHSILHARNLGTFVPSVSSANTLQTAVVAAYQSNLLPFQATTVGHGNLSVRDMSAATNPIFVATSGGAAGTSASPAMPAQLALVLSAKAIQRGRGFNARYYIPGWATNADAGGGIAAPALVTALAAYATSLFNAFTASGLQPAVAHPHRQQYTGITGTVHPERQPTAVDLQAWVLKDNIFDTVRARVKP